MNAHAEIGSEPSASSASATLLQVRESLAGSKQDLKRILPPHIPPDRFIRCIDTALQQNPLLLKCAGRAIFNAAMRAASDGLLPDGREGAIVPFKDGKASKQRGGDIWGCQWMPMVFGILKKIRNSGNVSTIVARVVYGGDIYRNWVDDEGEHILYEACDEPDHTIVRKVFAMAKLKDGSIEVEPLSPADIDKIRAVSRASESGPWVNWWEEMAKKSAIRRLAKRLPMSTDLDDLLRRDDDLYDFKAATTDQPQIQNAAKPRGIAAKLDAIAVQQDDDAQAGYPEIDGDTTNYDERQENVAPSQDGKHDEAQQTPKSEATRGEDRARDDYTDQMAVLTDAFEAATTEEQLLELADDAAEAWFNNAPQAVRTKASDLFEHHRKRIRKVGAFGRETPSKEIQAADATAAEMKPGEIDPAVKKAYINGMAEARKGSRKLAAWLNGLDPDTSELMDGYIDEFNEVAGEADRVMAGTRK